MELCRSIRICGPRSGEIHLNYRTGIDPNTGLVYPDLHVNGIFKTINALAFPDWPLFVRTLGADICYLSNINSVAGQYSSSAALFWRNNIEGYRGSCFGFAVSSLLAFDFPDAFGAYFPAVGTLTNLYDYSMNHSIRIIINQLFLYQFGVPDLLYDAQVINNSPRQTLQDLKSMFFSDIRNDRPLVFRNKNKRKSGVHELVPYAMYRQGSTSSFLVYLYDSNCPGGDCGNGKPQPIAILDSSDNSWAHTLRRGFCQHYARDVPRCTGKYISQSSNVVCSAL